MKAEKVCGRARVSQSMESIPVSGYSDANSIQERKVGVALEILTHDDSSEEVFHAGHHPHRLGLLLSRVPLPANRATVLEPDVLVMPRIHKSVNIVKMFSKCHFKSEALY